MKKLLKKINIIFLWGAFLVLFQNCAGDNIGKMAAGISSQSSSGTSLAVSVAAPVIQSLTSTQSRVSWILSGGAPTSLTLNGNNVLGSNFLDVAPTQTTTYTLVATNQAGFVSASITITVAQPSPSPSPSPTVSPSPSPVITKPTITSLTSNPSVITLGSATTTSTISWTLSGSATTSLKLNGNNVTGTSSVVTPTTTPSTSYTLVATNSAGSDTKIINITVNPAPTPTPSPSPSPSPTSTPPTGGTGTVTASFSSTTLNFRNPGRGWDVRPSSSEWQSVSTLQSFANSYVTGMMHMLINLGDDGYRTKTLDTAYLNTLRQRFTNARAVGIKVVPRVVYDYNGGSPSDTSIDWVASHANSLRAVFAENRDVLAMGQAGFIGRWGEWHDSTDGLDTVTNRANVRKIVLDGGYNGQAAMFPADLFVQFRYARLFTTEWYVGQSANTLDDLINKPTAKSRTAYQDDCMFTGQGDSSTYVSSADANYYLAGSEYAPFGGEDCQDSQGASTQIRSACYDTKKDFLGYPGGVMNEGPRYHIAILAYPDSTYQNDWTAQGCIDDVNTFMGYRFQLNSVVHPQSVSRGQSFNVDVNLQNVGWSRMFDGRKFVISIKRQNSSDAVIAVGSGGDARLFASNATSSTKQSFTTGAVPSSATPGIYDVYISMPDIFAGTAGLARYNIHFANKDNGTTQFYDTNTGLFKTGTTIVIQ